MQFVLDLVKKILPNKALNKIRPSWHGFLACMASVIYGFPSRSLVVIGITGTAGKSTTVQMLARILNDSGKKTGHFTTVDSFDGISLKVNKRGLSMPGGMVLQRGLRDMVRNRCSYAVIEATSEGLAQNRHLGIDFDVALFTNLAPAHIDSHGSFEKYKYAKAKLFASLARSKRKSFFERKIAGLNLDNEYSDYFMGLAADARRFGVTFKGKNFDGEIYSASQLREDNGKTNFTLSQITFEVNMPGEFNAYNALLAAGSANMIGIDLNACARSLSAFAGPAGRMEKIQGRDFSVYVDYAPEPMPMRSALIAAGKLPHTRLVHIFGSTGGHRDVGKRYEFGKISAQHADKIIITNDDVYDSDPEKIAEDIKQGIESAEQPKVREVEIVLDRDEAIKHAVHTAKTGDLILITGKGSEQFLVLPSNKRIDWDDRAIVKKYL